MADNVGSTGHILRSWVSAWAHLSAFCLLRNPVKRREIFFPKKPMRAAISRAAQKAKELRERADDLIERSKRRKRDAVKDSISAAVEGAREAYRREASKS